MNLFENCLILLGLPLGMILSGYWLATMLPRITAGERLAIASLAGLALSLWTLSLLNLCAPLAEPWVWLCLWPLMPTVLWPAARNGFLRDLAAVTLNLRGVLALVAAGVFVVVLLWPMAWRPGIVFFDGTSNHDAFFWITGAEHLQHFTYLDLAQPDSTHPLTAAINAIIGLRPLWGRMGAEGFLALLSSLLHVVPLKLYLAASVALFVPWVAATYLAVRTFLAPRLSLISTLALILFQPVFIYFHTNANLPNLLGALMAGGAVIATARALRPADGQNHGVWLVLLALSFHGLVCSYPEMIPFVLLPAGLLWLRVWWTHRPSAAWRPALICAAAWLCGLILNPASAMRAWFGFVESFETARANENWANLFQPLSPASYLPCLTTLSVESCLWLGAFAGLILSLLLLGGCAATVRRASDRVGAFFVLTGALVLLGYTLATGFNYGWQKTAQFGGIFWAAFFPVGLVETCVQCAPSRWPARLFARLAAVGFIGFFAVATLFNCFASHKWSGRKIITQDWFALRDSVRAELPGQPILVDGSSFRMAFFHGMWATYFLAANPIYFAARGEENGGYVRGAVANEADHPLPPIPAYLVSRDWADTFDANSPRWFAGDTVALLKTANRVTAWSGIYPDNGVPMVFQPQVTIDLLPHSPSRLTFDFIPRFPAEWPDTHWRITCTVDGAETYATEIAGPPPWAIAIPLRAAKQNHLEFRATSPGHSTKDYPFGIRRLRIETIP